MAKKESEKFTSIIESLKKINDSKRISFKLPSSKIEVELNPLQAKHISQINSSFMAGGSDGTFAASFIGLLKRLLTDVLILPEGNTFKDFDTIDMHYILFKMRELIDPIFNIKSGDGENDIAIDIKNHIKNLDKLKNIKKEITFGNTSCKVTLQLPSFEHYAKYSKFIEIAHKSARDQKKPNFENLTKDVFSFSILTYIYKLSVIVDKEEHEFIFSEETPANQSEILDHIPKDEYSEIFKSISKLTEPIQKCLETDVEDVSIPIDHTFLIQNMDS
jgi:hypothetical protein